MAMYTRIRGKVYGPFEMDRLYEMVQQGRLGRYNEVSHDGQTWYKASEEPALFASRSKHQTLIKEPEGLVLTEESGEKDAWFLSHDGITGKGPFTREVVLSLLAQKKADGNTLAWREGETARPIDSIPEFSSRSTDQVAETAPSTELPFAERANGEIQRCSKCQKEITENARYCPYCGADNGHSSTPSGKINRCPSCDTPLLPSIRNCPRCGKSVVCQYGEPCSRTVYILLALLGPGFFGFHNYYARKKNVAVFQLLLSLSLAGAPITLVWCIIDAFTVMEDGYGTPFI